MMKNLHSLGVRIIVIAMASASFGLTGCLGAGQASCTDEEGLEDAEANSMNCLRSCSPEEPCPEGYTCRGLGLCVDDAEYAALQNQEDGSLVEQCEGALVNGAILTCGQMELSATLEEGKSAWAVIRVENAPRFNVVDARSELYSIQVFQSEAANLTYEEEIALTVGFEAESSDLWIFQVLLGQEPAAMDQESRDGYVRAEINLEDREVRYFLGAYRMD